MRIKLLDFKPGRLWHINFALIDDGGPFAWPTQGIDAVRLWDWLIELNRRSDRRAIEMETLPHFRSTQNHSVNLASISQSAKERVVTLLSQEAKWKEKIDSELMCLRFCLAAESTERVWGVMVDPDQKSNQSDSVFFPLWWDPRHEVLAYSSDNGGRQSCQVNQCFHLQIEDVSTKFGLR